MSRRLWQWLRPQLPGWPHLPVTLWVWVLLLVSCGASLIYRQEIWPHTPQAVDYSCLGLLLAGHLVAMQLARALWRWGWFFQGPFWLRLPVAACAVMGVASLLVVLLLTLIGILGLVAGLVMGIGISEWAQ